MKLPYRLVGEAPSAPVLVVDGALGALGLELSHWPGNRTPGHLRHELSAGIALRFAALPVAERKQLAAGCTALVNNHYDTDGLCSAWAVQQPDAALALSERLLAVASSGDFFRFPDDHAFAIDALIGALVDPERSPLRSAFMGLDDRARYQLASDYALEHLGGWLGSTLEQAPLCDLAPLWQPALRRAHADLAIIDDPGTERLDFEHLDLTVFELHVGRDLAALPGRHAFFERSGRDRILISAPQQSGATLLRLVVGTRSWFDLEADQTPPPRFDLARVCAGLAAQEPETVDSTWHCEAANHASPELWFGGDQHTPYGEHNGALRPSQLGASQVLAAIEATLG